MIAAYPGFKGSKQDAKDQFIKPSEERCVRTPLAMIRALEKGVQIEEGWAPEAPVPPEKIILFGESLGGGVAIQAAHRLEHAEDASARRDIGGLVTFATFATLPKRVRELLPHYPAEKRMKNRYESLGYIKDISIPKLFLHGTKDPIIPHHHSEMLYEAAGGDDKELIRMEGANHHLSRPREDTPDPEQVSMAIDHVQDFLARRGLCPERDERYIANGELPGETSARDYLSSLLQQAPIGKNNGHASSVNGRQESFYRGVR
jgi:pimeloyl-ACP methyl ester carboxylesterase